MISKPPPIPRSLWITLEPLELIELKRIAMDHDGDGAITFFRDVLVPLLRTAAMKRGIALDMIVEDEKNECISG